MPSGATAGLSAQELLDRRRAQNKLAQRRFREKARQAKKNAQAAATAAALATTHPHPHPHPHPPAHLLQPHFSDDLDLDDIPASAPSPGTVAFINGLEQSIMSSTGAIASSIADPTDPVAATASSSSSATILMQPPQPSSSELALSHNSRTCLMPPDPTAMLSNSWIPSSHPFFTTIPRSIEPSLSSNSALFGMSPEIDFPTQFSMSQPATAPALPSYSTSASASITELPRSAPSASDPSSSQSGNSAGPHWDESRTRIPLNPTDEASYVERIGSMLGSPTPILNAFEQFLRAQSRPVRSPGASGTCTPTASTSSSSNHATSGSSTSGSVHKSSSPSMFNIGKIITDFRINLPNEIFNIELKNLPYNFKEVLQAYSSDAALKANNQLVPRFSIPRMSFTKAIVINAIRLGYSLDYLCDAINVSYVAESWSIWRQERKQRESAGLAAPADHERFHQVDEYLDEAKQRGDLPADPTNEDDITEFVHIKYRSRKKHLCDLDIPNPAPHVGLDKRLHWERVPDNMLPTREQLTHDHHPHVDIAFPWPTMRSRFLSLRDSNQISEDEFTIDILYSAFVLDKPDPFFVWGDDPMDPESWEVSEPVAFKYWGLFDSHIIQRTNWWRRQRGLDNLKLPKIDPNASPFVQKGLGTGKFWSEAESKAGAAPPYAHPQPQPQPRPTSSRTGPHV